MNGTTDQSAARKKAQEALERLTAECQELKKNDPQAYLKLLKMLDVTLDEMIRDYERLRGIVAL